MSICFACNWSRARLEIDLEYMPTYANGLLPTLDVFDESGRLLAHRSLGTKLLMVVPRTADYFIRASSAYELGTYLGNYAFPYLVISSSGDLEAEPNDSIATANSGGRIFLGNISADRSRFRAILLVW